MTAYAKSALGIWAQTEIARNPALAKLIQAMTEFNNNLDAILNRGARFEDNIDCRLVSVTSDATPGTEFSVAHTLGKIPVGYLVYGQNGAGSVYDGTTANTATTLFLKSDAASTSFRLIVI